MPGIGNNDQADAGQVQAQDLLHRSRLAAQEGDLARALAMASAAERRCPGWAPASSHVFRLLGRLGLMTEAMAALGRTVAAEKFELFESVNSLCSLLSLNGRADLIPQLAERYRPKAPFDAAGPFLFVGMPKSAGATIARSISEHLGHGFAGIGVDLPDWAGLPAPWLHPNLLQPMQGRRLVLLSHAAALPRNEAALNRFPAPILVHVRDPRDALVSLFEMGESISSLQMLRFTCIRSDYATLSRDEKVALLCARVYPLYLDWLAGWVAREQARPGAVRFSLFEEFVGNQEAATMKLARHFSGAEAGTSGIDIHVMHFRQGRAGAHREVLGAETSRRLFDAIPAAVRRRFAWES